MKEKIKKISLLIVIFLLSFVFVLNVIATSGACSWHGGVNCSAGADWDGSVICNDGWRDSSVSYYSMVECTNSFIPSIPNCPLNSYYYSFTDSCKCYSGYVVSNGECVSANSWCQNEYGYNSRYNILTDTCECNSGYEFTVKSGGALECESCISKYGLYSSYNYVDKKCECDEGYILGDNGCVIQQKTITCPLNSTLIGAQCFCDSGYIASGSSCITYTQNCQNKYGSHTYGDSNYCYCEEEYVWNKEKTKCISHTEDCHLIYGEHVVGSKGDTDYNSSCNCEKGYTWNSSRTACIQLEPASIFITTTTTTTTTKPITNTTKIILKDKNLEASISTQKTKVENSSDGKFINSSITEYQQETIEKAITQNWFTKTLGLIHIFLLKLFK